MPGPGLADIQLPSGLFLVGIYAGPEKVPQQAGQAQAQQHCPQVDQKKCPVGIRPRRIAADPSSPLLPGVESFNRTAPRQKSTDQYH